MFCEHPGSCDTGGPLSACDTGWHGWEGRGGRGAEVRLEGSGGRRDGPGALRSVHTPPWAS